MNRRPTSLPKSPLKSRSDLRRSLTRISAAAAMAMFLAGHYAQAANDAFNTTPTATGGVANFTGNFTLGTTTPGAGTGTPVSGDALYFGTSSTTTLNDDLAAGISFAGLTFNAGASAFTIGGNSFVLTGNVVNSSTSLQTINNAISGTAVRTFTMTTGGGNITLGGALTGATFGLTTAGAGTLTLSGASSYAGATTVATGTTLSLTGSLSGTAITTAGTGVFLQGSTGSIGGNASFTQNSTGISIFSGTNTYTGATTVSAGTLEFTSLAAQPTGTTTVGAGGTLGLAVGGAGQYTAANVNQYLTNTLARVNTVSRSLAIDTTAGDFNLGGLTLPTAASVSINKLGANALNLGAITRPAGSTVNFAVTNGTLTTTTANTGTSILGGFATFGGNTWAVSAGDGTTPGAITGLAAGSYTPSVAATTAPGTTADVDFQASNTTAYTGQTINSLRFNTAAATTLTLSGTNIITTGGILNTSTVGNFASTITGGTLAGSAGGELIVINNDTSNSITIGSIIANNGTATGLTKSGLGTLVLSGADTYSGATVVNGGILYLGNGSGSTASIVNTSSVTVAAGASLGFNYGNTTKNESAIIAGVISGAGGITDSQNNPNTVIVLDRANTYTGPTTFTLRGVLQSNVAAAYDANGNMISSGLGVNSALVFTGLSANVGETALLNSNSQLGSLSTVAATVANSAGNGIVLNNNNLVVGGDNTSTTFNAQISGGAIPNSATNTPRAIGGNLTKIGTGTQTLGGANLYSGSTTINGGTLSVTTIANGGFATTGTVGNQSNQLTLADATGAVAGQNIQGATLGPLAEVINSVSGNVVTLNGTSGTSATTGAATNTPIAFGTANGLGISTNVASNLVLNGGTLQYTGVAASTDRLFTVGGTTAGATGTLDASGTGAVNFTNTGAIAYGTVDQTRTVGLTGTNTGANTLAPSIGNNGAGVVNLVKSGTGSWTLTNANTYTGGTAVNAGTLFVNNTTGSGLGSGAVTVSPAATLGGTGILTVASVTVNSTGTLAPGATIGATTGALTLNTTSGVTLNGTLAITLGTTGNNGTFLNTTGGLMLGANSVLTVTGTSGLAAYELASYTAGTLSGTFTTLNIPTGYTVNYAGTDFGGTSIELVAVPEPSTWVAGLACFGLLGLGLARNRRKSSVGVKLSA